MANEQNLIPAKKGEIRNPNGKPKGTRHLSTIIRNIMEDIDWGKTNLKNKDEVQAKYGTKGWDALTYVAVTKAMAGDPKAMDWLAKNGFGTKLDLTTDDEPLNKVIVEWAKPVDEQDEDNNTD